MSKKNKKKYKANIQEMLGRVEKEEKTIKPQEDLVGQDKKQTETASSEDDKYIKQDILKICYGSIVCFIVLGIFWYLDANTQVVNNLSDNLANLLRIGK